MIEAMRSYMGYCICLIFLMLVVLSGCEKKSTVPVETTTGNQTSNRELSVEILNLVDPASQDFLPVADVEVRLFGSHENFITEQNEDRKMTSDSSGVIVFKSMKSGNYFIIGTHSVHGRLADSLNIPAGAIKSYFELIYY